MEAAWKRASLRRLGGRGETRAARPLGVPSPRSFTGVWLVGAALRPPGASRARLSPRRAEHRAVEPLRRAGTEGRLRAVQVWSAVWAAAAGEQHRAEVVLRREEARLRRACERLLCLALSGF